MYTARFTEQVAFLDKLDPDSYAAAEYNTGYNLLQRYHRAAVVLIVGDMAQGATLDMDIEQATDTSGTGAKAISGKSITQLTAAGNDSNKIVVVELRTEELDVDNAFDCVNAEVTVAGAAVEFALLLLGLEPRYPPVPTTTLEEVVD